MEIDENGDSKTIIGQQIKIEKAIELKLGHKFIRINPGKEDFEAIYEIFRYIKQLFHQLNKKILIYKVSVSKLV